MWPIAKKLYHGWISTMAPSHEFMKIAPPKWRAGCGPAFHNCRRNLMYDSKTSVHESRWPSLRNRFQLELNMPQRSFKWSWLICSATNSLKANSWKRRWLKFMASMCPQKLSQPDAKRTNADFSVCEHIPWLCEHYFYAWNKPIQRPIFHYGWQLWAMFTLGNIYRSRSSLLGPRKTMAINALTHF